MFRKTSRFTDRIDKSFDMGLGATGGILQDINELLTSNARNTINGLVGDGFEYSDANMKKIVSQVKIGSRRIEQVQLGQ